MDVSVGRGQRMFIRTSIASQLIQYALPSFLKELSFAPQPRPPEEEARYDRELTFRASYPLLDLVVSPGGCGNSAPSTGSGVTIEGLATAKNILGLILRHAAPPISDAALRTINGTLRGLSNPDATPYRSVLTWVAGHLPSSAALVPAPPEAIAEYVADLVGFVERDDVPSDVAAALTYYQLLTVHPFKDGNGRLARVLTALRCYQRQAAASHGVILAAGLSALKDDIARSFGGVFDGDVAEYLRSWQRLRSWVDSVAEFSVGSLLQMRVAVREKLGSSGWTSDYIKRVELSPIFSRAELRAVIRGSEKLAERTIGSLQQAQALMRCDAADHWVCVEGRAHWDRVRHFAISGIPEWRA